MAGYLFYIVNNEKVSKRIGTSDKQLDYTISGNTFCLSDLGDSVTLQMLKDTYFSMITSKNSEVEFEIVAVEGMANHKSNILDYYNNITRYDNIYPILKFRGNLGDNIKERRLTLTNQCSFEELKKILTSNLPDELILEIHGYLNTITLEMAVFDYENDLYISNPTFDISKTYLRQLINNFKK